MKERQNTTHTGHLGSDTLLHGRYRIQRVIGRGGMSAVYQAKDLQQGILCAVKEMSLSAVSSEKRARAIQNFKTEAKMLRGLRHPNLPAFTNFFSEHQRYFLVLEYIDGQTLEELLDEQAAPFSERSVLAWAEQLCDVLTYLHSQNPPIIFRDMKPGNVMLTRSGEIKLIDFGIARFFRPTYDRDTEILGTRGYAPPEQYGKAQTDERSDIYSLGMTLSHLLTNKLSEDDLGVKAKELRTLNPYLSSHIAYCLEKATNLDPRMRYESVDSFYQALHDKYIQRDHWVREKSDPHQYKDHLIERTRNNKYEFLHHDETAGYQAQDKQASSPRMPAIHRRLTIQISPRRLDFGTVPPSALSAPLPITISGCQGLRVRGTIHSSEPWIRLDRSAFDGTNTYVNVRIQSTQLQNFTHYRGSVIISLDEQNKQDIIVIVEADIQDYSERNDERWRTKKVIPDYEEDEEDFLADGQQILLKQENEDQKRKYGQPDEARWDPCPATANQLRYQRYGLAFCAAFMLGSLWYSLLLGLFANPLPPSPWFLIVLIGMIPATALGALLVQNDRTIHQKRLLNRLLIGMAWPSVFLIPTYLIWQILLGSTPGWLQLLLMLFITSLGATLPIPGHRGPRLTREDLLS